MKCDVCCASSVLLNDIGVLSSSDRGCIGAYHSLLVVFVLSRSAFAPAAIIAQSETLPAEVTTALACECEGKSWRGFLPDRGVMKGVVYG